MNEQPETFTPYDSADYLTSIDDVTAYLEAATEEAGDDQAFITHSVSLPAPEASANWRAAPA